MAEVVRAIKAELGAEFPLTLRLSGFERVAGGRPLPDTARIAPALGFTVFPVLESDGKLLQDSTVIIDVLEERHPERPAFPTDPVLMLVTRIVEFFIDEFWVATAMVATATIPCSNIPRCIPLAPCLAAA